MERAPTAEWWTDVLVARTKYKEADTRVYVGGYDRAAVANIQKKKKSNVDR